MPALYTVTFHNKGFGEADTPRVINAFVISRLEYGLPYLEVSKAEVEQAHILIRTAYKAFLVCQEEHPRNGS